MKCRATERLRRCKCWQCWESCKHRCETSGSASQRQHQFCTHSIYVCMYVLYSSLSNILNICYIVQCATHNKLTWSLSQMCDVLPIRPVLDNHHGIPLCSPICILVFRPSHQIACSRTGSRPLFQQILTIYPKQRSGYVFHKRFFPFPSFSHLLISLYFLWKCCNTNLLSLQHHPAKSAPLSHRQLWCVADEAQNRLQGRHSDRVLTRSDGHTDDYPMGMLLMPKISLLSKPPRHGNQSNSPQACWSWGQSRIWLQQVTNPLLKLIWHPQNKV